MTLEELQNREFQREQQKLERAQYIKLDPDQLIAIMTAIVISGRCFSDQGAKLVYQSARVAYDIYERIIREQQYTEYCDEPLE